MSPAQEHEIQRAVGRLEATVEALTREVKRSNEIATARLDGHGTRLMKVERRIQHYQSFTAGILAVFGVVYAILKLL